MKMICESDSICHLIATLVTNSFTRQREKCPVILFVCNRSAKFKCLSMKCMNLQLGFWLRWYKIQYCAMVYLFLYFCIQFLLSSYDSELDLGWCRRPDGVVKFFAVSLDEEVDGSFEFCRSWYSWKHGTMHKFVWHSGQWYFVFRRKIRPWASIVFQQKLQPNAGPGRITGQCWERFSNEISRSKCCK